MIVVIFPNNMNSINKLAVKIENNKMNIRHLLITLENLFVLLVPVVIPEDFK